MKKYLIGITSGLLVLALFATTATKTVAKPNSCTTIKDGTLLSSTGDVLETGYDQWGYNYQAHMFNGFYDNYSRPDTPVTSGDKLMMKWNDAWLANNDCDGDSLLDRHYGHATYDNSGAWLTNHMSGEYEDDTYHWDVSGDWVISVNSGAYLHDYTFTMTSLEDGTFTGAGGYPAGANPYIFDEIVINGQVNGDNVSFTANYYQGGNPTGYSWTATGTIDSSGEMSGTGTSGVSVWSSTSGAAEKVYDMCYWDYFVKIVTPSTSNGDYLEAGVWYNADNVEIGPVIWTNFAIVQEVENDECGELEGVQYKSGLNPGLGYYKEYGGLIQSLDVNADDFDGEDSVALEDGKEYKFVVSGTAFAGDTIDFDAEYSLTNRITADAWTDDVSGYTSYGTSLLDLEIDGNDTDWGLYSTSHVYEMTYLGTGDSVNFKVNDIHYPGNTGFLTVDIYELF